jgi:plastocyanin
MKATGVGILGLWGTTVTETVSGHETLHASAEDLVKPVYVPSKPEAGFIYPYYLYAPKPIEDADRPILVEPNNTGTATDDYSRHRQSAENLVKGSFSNTLSKALKVPLLVPVFPRPRSEPVDDLHYVHALDVDTLEVSEGPLARVDKQLLNMADHARTLLSELSYPVNDQIILNGFSASGNFVNRFAALHPEAVLSVSAGAVNGTAILPIAQDKGYTLNYHIGIADLESLIGKEFDLQAFNNVSQLIYIGAEDANDTIPYLDAWSDEQREKALTVYGQHMQDDRMPYCESVYEEVGADAEFKIYEGVGHKMNLEIQEDIVALHETAIAISRIEFNGTPRGGIDNVPVIGTVFETNGVRSFEARFYSDSRGDLTDTPLSLEAGQSFESDIALTQALDDGEEVTAAILESGVTDRNQAIASETTELIDEPTVDFAATPSAGSRELSLDYAVPASYEAESQIHIYVRIDDARREFVGTFPAGESASKSFQLDAEISGVPFETGSTVEVLLRDIDTAETIASSERVVGGGEATEKDSTASIRFADQPLIDETQVEATYSVDADYVVQSYLRIELRLPDKTAILLSLIDPGDEDTATFHFDKNPLSAGEEIEIAISDTGVLANDTATVLVQDNGEQENVGTPTPELSYRPDQPTTGEEVEFDASDSDSPNGDILSYEWNFGDGSSAAGEQVRHVFESPGDYTVTLKIVDEEGEQQVTEVTVSVKAGSPTETTKGTNSVTQVETGQPGFGFLEELLSLGGLGYLLKSRLNHGSDKSSDERER